MNSILPSVPLHMRKCTEMCPLKRGKKQILCSNWAHAQCEQRTTQLGMAAPWPLVTQTPQWLFPATYNPAPPGSLARRSCKTLGNTYVVLNASQAHLIPILLTFCAGKVESWSRMDTPFTKFSLPLFISPRRETNLLKIAQVCSEKDRSEFGLNDIFAL